MEHHPVLLQESLGFLSPGRGGVFVDCTAGLGGHTEALLAADPDLTVVAIDRDAEALELASRRLSSFGRRARFLRGDFRHLGELLRREGVERVAGVLADLGVSSLQLETPHRGFSFRLEGPLDMRMGSGELSAGDIVNRYSETELSRVFRELGEDRQARRLARSVIRARARGPITTTTQLRKVILEAKRLRSRPGGPREGRVDPATRVFQALRMEVNQELAALEGLLQSSLDLLETEGRLVVISYHSLEDRIVKNSFMRWARGEIDPITGRPLAETQLIEILTRKPVRPSAGEIALNPRSRSARLRAARRL